MKIGVKNLVLRRATVLWRTIYSGNLRSMAYFPIIFSDNIKRHVKHRVKRGFAQTPRDFVELSTTCDGDIEVDRTCYTGAVINSHINIAWRVKRNQKGTRVRILVEQHNESWNATMRKEFFFYSPTTNGLFVECRIQPSQCCISHKTKQRHVHERFRHRYKNWIASVLLTRRTIDNTDSFHGHDVLKA